MTKFVKPNNDRYFYLFSDKANIKNYNNTGVITSVPLGVGGSGYTSVPTVSVVNNAGYGANIRAIVTGSINNSIQITNGGAYTSAPSVSFSAGGSGAVATATITGAVTSLTLGAGGSGYTSTNTVVSITGGGGGSGATANAIITGTITSITLTYGGYGFTSAPTVTIEGGGGTGATYTATVSGGAITGFTLVNAGTGYTSVPNVIITGGGGGVGVVCTPVLTGSISGFTLTSGGSGYTSAPTVTITGSGTLATATSTITGAVTSVTVSAAGSGYPSTTQVIFSGNGGASASLTVTGAVTSYEIVSGGSGYTTPITCQVTGGGGTGATVGTVTVNTPAICYEYRWNIPDIQLNDDGKLSLISHTYKTFANTSTPVKTSIINLGSKNIVDTSGGRGAILDISNWNVATNIFPSVLEVDVAPQVINNITLSIDEDMSVLNSGSTNTNVFCIVLKLTEGDLERVEFGSTNNLNVNQRQIPYY